MGVWELQLESKQFRQQSSSSLVIRSPEGRVEYKAAHVPDHIPVQNGRRWCLYITKPWLHYHLELHTSQNHGLITYISLSLYNFHLMLRTDIVLWVWLLSQSYFMHTAKTFLRIQMTSDEPTPQEQQRKTVVLILVFSDIWGKIFFKVKNQFANFHPLNLS